MTIRQALVSVGAAIVIAALLVVAGAVSVSASAADGEYGYQVGADGRSRTVDITPQGRSLMWDLCHPEGYVDGMVLDIPQAAALGFHLDQIAGRWGITTGTVDIGAYHTEVDGVVHARVMWDCSDMAIHTMFDMTGQNVQRVYFERSALVPLAVALQQAGRPHPSGEMCGFVTGKEGDWNVVTGDQAWEFLDTQIFGLHGVRAGWYSLDFAIEFARSDTEKCVLEWYKSNQSGEGIWVYTGG